MDRDANLALITLFSASIIPPRMMPPMTMVPQTQPVFMAAPPIRVIKRKKTQQFRDTRIRNLLDHDLSPPGSPPGLPLPRVRGRRIVSDTGADRDQNDWNRNDWEAQKDDETLQSRSAEQTPRTSQFSSSLPPLRTAEPRYPTLPTRYTRCRVSSAPNLSAQSDVGTIRPELPRQAVSEPDIVTKSMESDIDDAIADLLRNRDGKKPSKEPGFNYIFQGARDGDTNIYKVGKSESPTDRRRSLKSTCRFETLTKLSGTACPPIRWYLMAERLVQAELGNHRYHGFCPCGTKHRELFCVQDVETLLEIHRRWHNFCASEPWDEDGRLLPKWKHRLDSRQGVREGCGQGGLADSWREFVNPTTLEKLTWSATYIWSRVCPFRWQAGAIVASLLLAHVSTAAWALVWLFSVTVAILSEAVMLHQTWLPGMVASVFRMALHILRISGETRKAERTRAASGQPANRGHENTAHHQSHSETHESDDGEADVVEYSGFVYEQDQQPGNWSNDHERDAILLGGFRRRRFW